MKLIWLAALAVIGWRWLTGRWPWDSRSTGRTSIKDAREARALLGLPSHPDRAQILAAHRALVVQVHPDRGGSAQAVYAADAARDLLLAEAAKDRYAQ